MCETGMGQEMAHFRLSSMMTTVGRFNKEYIILGSFVTYS